MASHGQSYRAGQAEGRAREKGEQMKESVKEKGEAAKQKTLETAEAIKDKTRGGGGAGSTDQKSKETSASAKARAEEAKEKSGGILQQTGDKVKNMAQGATETVKNTFGLADADDDQHIYPKDTNY
ncbi:hypothetical protein GQ457_01G017990 [Hibiscus cannabinus]